MSFSWKFYTSTPDAWEAMLAECESAKTSIDLEQFIFLTDEIGRRFIDVLRRRARAGVRVRIIADAAGSVGMFTSNIPNELKKDGIEIAFFNSFMPGARSSHTPWFFRDHQKLLVIDAEIGFTGGICIGDRMRRWRDTHVRVEGTVVKEMKEGFEVMWRRANKLRRIRFRKRYTSDGDTHYLLTTPLPTHKDLYDALIEAIRSAREYIYLTTPYFSPDKRLSRVLRLAARRGVDVRIIMPQLSDHFIVDVAAESHFTRLLRSGVRIFRYGGRMIHAKTGVIDGNFATVGSLNLDNVSLSYNFEGNIVSQNEAFAQELRQHFLNDLSSCTEVNLARWEKRSYFQILLEWLIVPIRPFL